MMELHKTGFEWGDEEAPKHHDTKWRTCKFDKHAQICKFTQGVMWDSYHLQDGFMAKAPCSSRDL